MRKALQSLTLWVSGRRWLVLPVLAILPLAANSQCLVPAFLSIDNAQLVFIGIVESGVEPPETRNQMTGDVEWRFRVEKTLRGTATPEASVWVPRQSQTVTLDNGQFEDCVDCDCGYMTFDIGAEYIVSADRRGDRWVEGFGGPIAKLDHSAPGAIPGSGYWLRSLVEHRVVGTVRSAPDTAHSTPIAHQRVELDGAVHATATTNKHGVFLVDGLPPGRYAVSVSLPTKYKRIAPLPMYVAPDHSGNVDLVTAPEKAR